MVTFCRQLHFDLNIPTVHDILHIGYKSRESLHSDIKKWARLYNNTH